MKPLRTTLILCTVEVLGLSGLATFASLLPFFLGYWHLSNTQAGWLSAVYYGAYVTAVPLLTALTDRRDARKILLLSLVIGAFSCFGFAFWATGFKTALLFRFMAGISLAGVYMPGLKLLSDHVEGPRQSRYVSFYTASFSLGASLSYLLAGEAHEMLGWQWAFGLSGVLNVMAIGVVLVSVPTGRIDAADGLSWRWQDLMTVLANRPALGYILGYAAHMWELFSMRSWMVAFLAYSLQLQNAASVWLSPTQVVALINLIGLPASIAGNELCQRFKRRKTVMKIMLVSALTSVAVGFSAPLPYPLVVIVGLIYGVVVLGDSASLTAGAVAAAAPGQRGATLAVHSTLGFGAAFLGPLTVGVVLDLLQGTPSLGWGVAFVTMGAGCALGPVLMAAVGKKNSVSA